MQEKQEKAEDSPGLNCAQQFYMIFNLLISAGQHDNA